MPRPIRHSTPSKPCVLTSSAFFSILPRTFGSPLSTHSASIASILSGAHACIVPLHDEQGSILASKRSTRLRLLLLQFRQIRTARSLSRRSSRRSRRSLSDHDGRSRSRSLFGLIPRGPGAVCTTMISSSCTCLNRSMVASMSILSWNSLSNDSSITGVPR